MILMFGDYLDVVFIDLCGIKFYVMFNLMGVCMVEKVWFDV